MASVTKANKSGGQSVAFPDVCKVPAPPAPFVPIPYPNSQFEENLRKANAIDAKAEAGTLKGIMSAGQAVRAGRTVHFSGGSAAVKNARNIKVFGNR